MKKSYYDILEVNKNASPEVIEKTYKVLVKKYHPDIQETDKKAFFTQKLKDINKAYDTLSDIEKRKQYDMQLEELEKEVKETSYEQKVHEPEVINTNSNMNYDKSLQKINNSFALASFICSMVGLLIFGIPCGVAAIVTGILGLVKFDSEKEKNKWMAIVGLVVGIFDFIIVAMYNVIRTSSSLL